MATYYIGPSGSDTAPGVGSAAFPWLTLTKAMSSSAPGDTIRVLPGTTTWVSADYSGSGSRTILADNGDPNTTIFNAGGGNVAWQISPGTLTMQNLQFLNAVATGSIFTAYVAPAATVSFERCIFRDLFVPSNRAIIGQSTNLGSINLLACLFDRCLTSGSGNQGYIALQTVGVPVNVTNCVFYSDEASSDTLNVFQAVTADVVMKNNIFYTTGAVAFAVSGTPDYTGSTNNLNFGFTGFPSIPNTLTSDPLFVDPPSANFNLRPGSPAIDAGVII